MDTEDQTRGSWLVQVAWAGMQVMRSGQTLCVSNFIISEKVVIERARNEGCV